MSSGLSILGLWVNLQRFSKSKPNGRENYSVCCSKPLGGLESTEGSSWGTMPLKRLLGFNALNLLEGLASTKGSRWETKPRDNYSVCCSKPLGGLESTEGIGGEVRPWRNYLVLMP